jgi:predicted phosphodiesterase
MKWSKREDKFLRKLYPKSTQAELFKFFKRSVDSIQRRANRLKIKKEVDFYTKHFSNLKIQEVEKMVENPLKEYEGKDKIVGRPIRLNYQVLKADRSGTAGKYATVKFCGDWHYGSKECDKKKLKEVLDFCLREKMYVFLMGDLLEAATRNSVGAGVYQQIMNPQKQMEEVIELLKPLADKKLILGCLMGNHEFRIEKETSINVTKVFCAILKIPYLGNACWNLFKVGNQYYRVYALHGSSGSKYLHTKLKAIMDISHNFSADLMVMGHVHDIDAGTELVQYVDLKSKTVKERKKHLLLTGHYLNYDGSYAQEKGFPIGKTGSPNVKFFSERKDVHIAL